MGRNTLDQYIRPLTHVSKIYSTCRKGFRNIFTQRPVSFVMAAYIEEAQDSTRGALILHCIRYTGKGGFYTAYWWIIQATHAAYRR
jgi:hypothetical protein